MASPVKFNRIYSGLLTAAMLLAGDCLGSEEARGATVRWKGATSSYNSNPYSLGQNSWWSAGWTSDPTGRDVFLDYNFLSEENRRVAQSLHLGTYYKTFVESDKNIITPAGRDTINSLAVRGMSWSLVFSGSALKGPVENGGLIVSGDATIGASGPGGVKIVGMGSIGTNSPDFYHSMIVRGNLRVGEFPTSVPDAQKASVLELTSKARLSAVGQTLIGSTSHASLAITGGANLNASNNVTLGLSPGIKGTARVGNDSAPGGLLNTQGSLFVGSQGTGSLEIAAQGKVAANGDLYAGFAKGSRGGIVVAAPGSRLTSRSMIIGKNGVGALKVSLGGYAGTTTGDLVVGTVGGAKGSVSIVGSDSIVSAKGTLRVVNGTVNLDRGKLHSSTAIELAPGGRLIGTGTVIGPLKNGGRMETSGLTISGGYSQTDAGVLQALLPSSYLGATGSLITLGGIASLGGTLDVDVAPGLNSSRPLTGALYTLVHANQGVSGKFTSVKLPTFSDAMWALDYTSFRANLRLLVPGDYNHDLTVNSFDRMLWSSMSGMRGLGLAADGNWDGVVDSKDLALVTKYFGKSAQLKTTLQATSALIATSIPEPSTVALVGVAFLCTGGRRRALPMATPS